MKSLTYVSDDGTENTVSVTLAAEFSPTSSILVDLHSMQEFSTDIGIKRLSSKTYIRHYIEDLHTGGEQADSTRQLMEVLSHFICFGKIVLDARAMQTFSSGHTILDALKRLGVADDFTLVEFPREAYTSAVASIMQLRSQMTDADKDRFERDRFTYMQQILKLDGAPDFDDYIWKDLHDGNWNRHFKEPLLGRVANIGNTGESVERLLVYLEVSTYLDIPATLSRSKHADAEAVGKKLANAADRQKTHEERVARHRSGLESLQTMLSQTALAGRRIVVPPLPARILQVARDRSLSIIDAAKWIRNSPDAMAFREWIWSKRRLLHSCLTGEILEKEKLQTELQNIGERIRRAGSSDGVFVDRWTANLRLAKIPVIGALLNAASLDALAETGLPVPLAVRRNPPVYEVFVASWFSSSTSPRP